jgi:HSP20 family protein
LSFWNIEPEDWFRRFFGGPTRRGERRGWYGTGDIFREFDDMRREMERMFEEGFRDITTNVPKELVREYETPGGGKVREIGPVIYGYSMTIGPDGKPRVREFGNVRGFGGGTAAKPSISAEREPLADVTTTDKEVKVIVEMPGTSKENIKINAYDGSVEIVADMPNRRYRRVVDLPQETDIETAKSTYKNGILEVTFNKKSRPRGKNIKVE